MQSSLVEAAASPAAKTRRERVSMILALAIGDRLLTPSLFEDSLLCEARISLTSDLKVALSTGCGAPPLRTAAAAAFAGSISFLSSDDSCMLEMYKPRRASAWQQRG